MIWAFALTHWRGIMLTVAVALVVGGVWAWIAGMQHAIHAAQNQRNVAVISFVRSEVDLVTARINEAVLRTGIDRQNAAVTALGAERDRTVAALAVAAQRARVATVAANRSAAALLAGHAGRDPCRSALDVARSLP